MEVKCDMCNLMVKRKTDLARHKKSETCKKIKKVINDILLEKEEFYKNIQNENNEYKLQIRKLIEENKQKEIQIKLIQEKYEDLLKIVEKSSTLKLNFKNKEFIPNTPQNDSSNFQIDINIDNKQFNKTKYKDVPEEQISFFAEKNSAKKEKINFI
jgi:hypothetical protein